MAIGIMLLAIGIVVGMKGQLIDTGTPSEARQN